MTALAARRRRFLRVPLSFPPSSHFPLFVFTSTSSSPLPDCPQLSDPLKISSRPPRLSPASHRSSASLHKVQTNLFDFRLRDGTRRRELVQRSASLQCQRLCVLGWTEYRESLSDSETGLGLSPHLTLNFCQRQQGEYCSAAQDTCCGQSRVFSEK